MKPRIVLWGENAQDQKVLLAFALRAEENRVDLHIVPADDVTEQLEKDLMSKWRKGEAVEIPATAEKRELELRVTDGLLPDDLRTNDTDLITRAQAEWHFAVLSAKMQMVYQSELEDLKEKVGQLTDYDGATWESLKGFWGKVQQQVRDGNLLRGQADKIKRGVNEAFAQMKELRGKADKEFSSKSAELKTEFMEKVDEIEAKINEGARLSPLFDQLKALQKKYFNTKFTRDHRDQVWKRIDGAFKAVKEKRYGADAAQQSPANRTERRLQGLHGAIEKMERSVKRDEDDLTFQRRKIQRTEGQLEAQIREAKIVMINERLNSKKAKLEDMLKTRKSLEERLEREKKKEEARKEKERQREEKRKAEEARKAEIAAKIAEQQKSVSEAEAEKLRQAAASISNARKKSDQDDPQPATAAPKADYASATPVQEDDNLIIHAATIGAAIDHAVNGPVDAPDVADLDTEIDPPGETVLSALGNTLGESIQDVVDDVRAVASVLADKVSDAVEDIKDNLMGEEE